MDAKSAALYASVIERVNAYERAQRVDHFEYLKLPRCAATGN